MDNYQKYSRLMLLIGGLIFGFIVFIALLVFLLRLLSATVSNIPGLNVFYGLVITCFPYFLFFTAYFFLFGNLRSCKSRAARIVASLLMLAGIILCVLGLSVSTALFLKMNNSWVNQLEVSSHYALVVQVAALFLIAAVLAIGAPPEKDWREKKS